MSGEVVVVQSIRESLLPHSESPVTHFPKRERFGRTPDSVLKDKRLSLEARAVYAGMARHAFKNGHVYIGQRRLAEYLNTSQRTVGRRLQELCACKHVELTEPTTRGRRADYRLLSTVFQVRPVAKDSPYAKLKKGRNLGVRGAAAAWANRNDNSYSSTSSQRGNSGASGHRNAARQVAEEDAQRQREFASRT